MPCFWNRRRLQGLDVAVSAAAIGWSSAKVSSMASRSQAVDEENDSLTMKNGDFIGFNHEKW